MLGLSIDDGVYMVTEGARCRVEIDAAEVVVDGVELVTVFGECAGGTEIERTPVGREHREGLVNGVLLEQGREQQLVLLDVIDLNVGGFVEDLNAITVGTMEQLSRSVGGIGNIAARRMPIGIDAKAEGLWGLGVSDIFLKRTAINISHHPMPYPPRL